MLKRGRHPIVSILLLVVTGVLLVGAQEKTLGWVTFGLGVLSLQRLQREQLKDLLLPYLLLAILGLTPIGTELTNSHMATMGTALATAIAVPALLSKRWSANASVLRFPWRMRRPWTSYEMVFVALTIILAYLVLPLYLRKTGAYLNWNVDANRDSVLRLFLGTNAVGLWDELAFIAITLSVLRRYLPFYLANLAQAVLFTSFLYELGFTSWGLVFVFPFALTQGAIFNMTASLSYVVTVHLSLDFVLFLAIINAHHPQLCPVFVT